MCIADTRIIPSRMPLFLSAASTWGVILMYSLCFLVRKVRYSVWNSILNTTRTIQVLLTQIDVGVRLDINAQNGALYCNSAGRRWSFTPGAAIQPGRAPRKRDSADAAGCPAAPDARPAT